MAEHGGEPLNCIIVEHRPKVVLTDAERVLLYLTRDIPLPEGVDDDRALPRTPTELARRLSIHMPSLQHILERHERDGLVQRHPIRIRSDEHHRAPRRVVYLLTDDGATLARDIRRRWTR